MKRKPGVIPAFALYPVQVCHRQTCVGMCGAAGAFLSASLASCRRLSMEEAHRRPTEKQVHEIIKRSDFVCPFSCMNTPSGCMITKEKFSGDRGLHDMGAAIP